MNTPLDQPADPALLLPGEDLSSTRRSFLRAFGFGIAASALAGCSRGPRKELLTWVAARPGVVANRAYHVATACLQCPAGCGVLARCKDGRPLKLEGLPGHPLGAGALCAMGQAGILELYDSHRFTAPLLRGQPSTLAAADAAITAALTTARSGGRVRLLTGTVHSPSTRAWIRRFLARHPGSRHLCYDPLSCAAILDAHERTHGVRALPRYRFEQADVIAAFDADFLGTWIAPVEFAAGYAAARQPGAGPAASQPAPRMARHWQFEARVSLTGGRADVRRRLAPWEMGPALRALAELVADRAQGGHAVVAAPQGDALAQLADELWAARGRALVVCGHNDLGCQTQVNRINHTLLGYGRTLDLAQPSQQRLGRDADVAALRDELRGDLVDVLIVAGVNPAYDFAAADELGTLLTRSKFLVTLASVPDETTALSTWVLPEPHALEAWHDLEPVTGCFGLVQPTLPPLRPGRTLRATLAAWCGDARSDLELLREVWQQEIHPRAGVGGSFDRFFRRVQREGFVAIAAPAAAQPGFRAEGVVAPGAAAAPAGAELGLLVYPKVALQDGRHAHNAWLQELADPVSRLAWESYATLAPATAQRLGLAEGDVVRLTAAAGLALELPVHLQPGQHEQVVAVAMGYGRAGTERFATVGPEWLEGQPTVRPGERLGVSAAPFTRVVDGQQSLASHAVTAQRTGVQVALASTQEWHSLRMPAAVAPADNAARDAVRSTTWREWQAAPGEAIPHPHVPAAQLWPEDHRSAGPTWGMAIDLAACTGCSACVIACQAENNVPVVGRDEVRRHREMAWLRIDRYQDGDGDALSVAHQPMMCQHCGNAPCESVCPVLATVHSQDGLNQQVYNRCVGTRYCANTCPYKVRRFNWFDYPHQDAVENLLLNPDVTVRTRGVMEKCSLCVQRIQDARLEARRRGVPLAEGDIQTACQQTCPTRAITFGNSADPRSRVSQLGRSPRAYRVLEELNVAPVVRYLAIVRNPPEPA